MTVPPTAKVSESRKAEFLRLLATGETTQGAARTIGVTVHGFYGARKLDPTFRDAWATAMAGSAEARAALIRARNWDGPPAKTKFGRSPPGGKVRDPSYRRRLLVALARGSSVTKACEQADVSVATATTWRKSDPEFSAAWDVAVQAGIDRLEDEAFRRGVEGYDEFVFNKDKIVGTQRRYSDALLALMLRAKHANYRCAEPFEGGSMRIGTVNIISVPTGTFLTAQDVALEQTAAAGDDPPDPPKETE